MVYRNFSSEGRKKGSNVEFSAHLQSKGKVMLQYLRALFIRALPLPIHRPTPPDRWFCHQDYGYNIVPLDCQRAVDNNWPSGKTPLHYNTKDPSPSNSVRLPQTHRFGKDQLHLERESRKY